MTTEIAVIGAVQAVVVAVLGGLFHRDSKKRKEADEISKRSAERAERRAGIRGEESLLAIKLMSANVRLSIASAKAIINHEVNGIMESALVEAEQAEAAYQSFLKKMALEHISEGGLPSG